MKSSSVSNPDGPAAEVVDGWVSDEELTALAVAADPSAPLPADAVAWTMPSPGGLAFLPG